ncbi:MAG: TIGR04552 family protein [Proteobacteria bacterium]|nr:TIGR04552 family protein [Pseudomonadota bacterium]
METVDAAMNPENHAETLSNRRAAENIWAMPWQELAVVLGQQNILTHRSFNIPHRDRALEFLRHCGFDLGRFEHRKQIDQFFGEALFFIRHVLLSSDEREKFPVPADLLHLDDPRRLMVYASQRMPRRRYLRLWSCSILKVMNAISHLEYNGKLRELESAREQIFGRIRSIVTHRPNAGWRARSNNLELDIEHIEWKEAKTRHSVLLKLLHKPEAMAEEVFDYLGVRFVVSTPQDIARLLRILIETDIIIPHQALSLRTRNSLLNLSAAQRQLSLAYDLFHTGTTSPKEFLDMCEKVNWSFPSERATDGYKQNMHSSSKYKSIQLTVRHLVRTPNPAFLVLSSLAGQLRHARGLEPEDDPLLMGLIPEENARFFPLEIQIFDQSSFRASQFGPASHEQYKSNQSQTVRKKVLGSLLHFNETRLQTQDY